MLDIIRNLVSSIFGKILLALMVLSFALWGVGDILTSGNTQHAAKVGNYKITLNEFYNNFQKSISDFNQQVDQKITLAEAHERQIDLLVLNELVYEKMILAYADKNNIYISDDVLRKTIKSLEQFQNENGSFNRLKYEYSIQTNFQSEKELLNEIKLTYLRSLMFDDFSVSQSIDNKIIDLIDDHEAEERNIEYVILSNPKIDKKSIKDEDIEDFFNKKIEDYRIPKKIIVNFLEINFDDLKKGLTLTDDVIKNYYNENINNYKQEEMKTIRFARLQDKEVAIKIKKIFEDNDKDNLDIFANENGIKINKIDNLKYDDFDQSLSSKIFKLNLNEVSDVIESDELGYYVVEILSEIDETITSFKEAKKDIFDSLISEKAYELFDENITIADELNLEGFDLDYIANELSIINNKNIPFNSLVRKIDNKNLMIEIQNEEIGFQSELILSDINAMIIKIDNIKESYIPSLIEVKEKVLEDLIIEKKNKIFEEKISIAINDIGPNGLDGFNQFASINNLEKKEIKNLKRNLISDVLPSDILNKIFKAQKNSVIQHVYNGEYKLILVKDIAKPSEIDSNSIYEDIKRNIHNNFNITSQNSLEFEIISNIEYEIFNQNISNLF